MRIAKIFHHRLPFLLFNSTILPLGTLRSDNGDVHENVAEKQTSHHFIPIIPIIPIRPVA